MLQGRFDGISVKNPWGWNLCQFYHLWGFCPGGVGRGPGTPRPPCAMSTQVRGGGPEQNKARQISWEPGFVFPSRRVTQISARAPVTRPTATRCAPERGRRGSRCCWLS